MSEEEAEGSDKMALLALPIHYGRRVAKIVAMRCSSAYRSAQSLHFLGPMTLIVAIFTVHTLLMARTGGDELVAADDTNAAQADGAAGGGAMRARPLPKAKHMSRKLLIEMVKSKGLWTDTTRRPVIQSLHEKIKKAAEHAVNRSALLEQEQKEQRKRMKPFEYWKIGGEHIRLEKLISNSTGRQEQSLIAERLRQSQDLGGLRQILGPRDQEGQEEQDMNSTSLPDISTHPTVELPTTEYPLLHDEIVYLLKTAGMHEEWASAAYQAWGKAVSRLVVSTDIYLKHGVPGWKQRVAQLNQMGRRLFRGPQAVACVTTFLNLAKVLQAEELYDAKWLVIVDDDTFIVPDNVKDFLARYEHTVPYYLGFSAVEAANLLPEESDKPEVADVVSTSAGVAYSMALLQVLRHNLIDNLQLTKIHDRCSKARMRDDVALGLLALDNSAELVSRPDLAAYHEHDDSHSPNVPPLSIHLQLDAFPKDISRFASLSQEYINMTAGVPRDYGEDFAENVVHFI